MQIEWTTGAVKEMRKIPGNRRDQIIAKIEQFAAAPSSLANMVTRLVDSDLRRLRVGDYRVVFRLESGDTMVVLRVRHRRDAYE